MISPTQDNSPIFYGILYNFKLMLEPVILLICMPHQGRLFWLIKLAIFYLVS